MSNSHLETAVQANMQAAESLDGVGQAGTATAASLEVACGGLTSAQDLIEQAVATLGSVRQVLGSAAASAEQGRLASGEAMGHIHQAGGGEGIHDLSGIMGDLGRQPARVNRLDERTQGVIAALQSILGKEFESLRGVAADMVDGQQQLNQDGVQFRHYTENKGVECYV